MSVIRELLPCQTGDAARGTFMVHPRTARNGRLPKVRKGQVVQISATWTVREGFERHPEAFDFIVVRPR